MKKRLSGSHAVGEPVNFAKEFMKCGKEHKYAENILIDARRHCDV